MFSVLVPYELSFLLLTNFPVFQLPNVFPCVFIQPYTFIKSLFPYPKRTTQEMERNGLEQRKEAFICEFIPSNDFFLFFLEGVRWSRILSNLPALIYRHPQHERQETISVMADIEDRSATQLQTFQSPPTQSSRHCQCKDRAAEQ